MIGSIPFEVPAKFAGELAAGNLIRAGTLLKDTASGQIVAHLQETGLSQKLLNTALGSPFSPLNAISAPSSLVANAQLAQLKSMVQGLEMLQFANLGATAAGIGVSAIGFALINSKLNKLQGHLGQLADRVGAGFRDLWERDLREHFARVQGLFRQADQAHTLSSPASEWLRISGLLADESSYFETQVRYVLTQDVFEADLFEELTRSLVLCNAGRLECLVLSGELKAAHRVSSDQSIDYNRLFDPLTPTELAHRSIANPGNTDQPLSHEIKQRTAGMKVLVSNLRDVQDSAMSKPYLLETLMDRRIEGAAYMRAINEEQEEPILLLGVD